MLVHSKPPKLRHTPKSLFTFHAAGHIRCFCSSHRSSSHSAKDWPGFLVRTHDGHRDMPNAQFFTSASLESPPSVKRVPQDAQQVSLSFIVLHTSVIEIPYSLSKC